LAIAAGESSLLNQLQRGAIQGIRELTRKGNTRMPCLNLPRTLVLALALTGAASLACADPAITRVTGSIDVGPGEHTGDVSTVNGSIRAGESATLGHAHTVNGSISLDRQVTAEELSTVNGSIRIDEQARVSGAVRTVNGKLSLADGADVSGNLANVNGTIKVGAAHVGAGINTVSGDIVLGPNARIDGGVHVGRPDSDSSSWGNRQPRVVVGPGSVVNGTLRFERPVQLYVSERATIGAVEGASAVKFAGDAPPE
jgi:cytoskeletal protein CcmA (bactofilin family)